MLRQRKFLFAMKLFAWSLRICPDMYWLYFLEYVKAIAEVGLEESG